MSREHDWNGWVSFFLAGLVEQARTNTKKTQQILALYSLMKQEVPKATRSQYAIQAIDALFDHPVFRSTDFVERSGIPRISALRILRELKQGGLVSDLRPGGGRRAAVMIFPELLEITERQV